MAALVLAVGAIVVSALVGAFLRSLRSRDRRIVQLEQQRREAQQAHAAVVKETAHLVSVRLPAVLDARAHRHPGVVVPGLGDQALEGTSISAAHAEIIDVVGEAVNITQQSIGRAARAGVRGLCSTVQTELVKQQMVIDQELHNHLAAPEYHQSLMNIDRPTTRALHEVQRLLILSGSWPGKQRANCSFREIVESARGRTNDYERITFTYVEETAEVYVEGRVVEPITMALTELLDNAVNFTAGQVGVYVQEAQGGYIVVVEDTGRGMNAFQRKEAATLLKHSDVMDVTTLTDERRLGFGIVGRLANEYGFHVDVEGPSSGGGVKAVTFVPRGLLDEAPAEQNERAETSSAPALADIGQPPRTTAGASTASGLPRRARRRSAEAAAAAPPVQQAVTEGTDVESFAAGFGHLRDTLSTAFENPTSQGPEHG